MRNMWTIFTRDIRKIRTNVIALIVVLGVTVVPCPITARYLSMRIMQTDSSIQADICSSKFRS